MVSWKRLWLWTSPLTILAVACGGAAAPTATRPAAAPAATAAPATAAAVATATPPRVTVPTVSAAATPTPLPTAVGAKKAPRGAMVYVAPGDYGTNDPPAGRKVTDTIWHTALYGERWTVDANGVERPSVFKSWRFIDPTHVEVKVRDDILFHDGTPFEARDIMTHWLYCEKFESALSGCIGGGSPLGNLYAINSQPGPAEEAFTFPDKYTAVLRLDKPRAVFLLNLRGIGSEANYLYSLKQMQAAGDKAPEVREANPIGAGPYKFVSRSKGDYIKLTAFDRWYGPVVGDDLQEVKDITFRFAPEPQTRIAALRTGEADVIDAVLPSDVATIERDPSAGLKVAKTYPNQYIGIFFATNPITAKIPGTDIPSPFMKKRVRQALIMAIDREAIRTGIMRGLAGPAPYLWNPPMLGADPDYAKANPMDFDAKRARQILEEEKFPFDQEFKLRVYSSSAGSPQSTEAACGMWNNIGVKCKWELVDLGVLVREVLAEVSSGKCCGAYPFHMGRWQTQANEWGVGSVMSHLRTPLARTTYNSETSDLVLDKIIDDADSIFDTKERDAQWKKAYRRIWDEALTFPLYQDVLLMGLSKRVDWTMPGATYEPLGIERVRWRAGFP